jgi:hypothetical protein
MSEIDNSEVKSAVEKFGEAFEEFKATNDKRLTDLEKDCGCRRRETKT